MQQMWGIVLSWVFLAWGSIMDIKTRTIPVWLPLIFGTAGCILIAVFNTDGNVAGRLLPGGMMLAAGFFTGWKIGAGDGLCTMVLGLLVGAEVTLRVLMYGLFLSAVMGILLLTVKKRSIKAKMPFLPFLAAGLGIEMIGIINGY